MKIFFEAYSQADFFGKMIFLSLFILSCVCWIFIIKKMLFIKRIKRESIKFKKYLALKKNNIFGVEINCNNPFSSIYKSLRERLSKILDKNCYFTSSNGTNDNYLSNSDIKFLINNSCLDIAKENSKIETRFFILPTIVTLAPFLGLLGTVWGILITFNELKLTNSISSNFLIFGGLSTALTTTVLGLLIAIPALIAHGYLKSIAKEFFFEMHDFSNFLMSNVELQYRKVDLP